MKNENKIAFIDADSLRETSTEDLQKAAEEARESLLHLREEASVGAPRTRPDYQKPHLLRGYRRLIARIETVLNERRRQTSQRQSQEVALSKIS